MPGKFMKGALLEFMPTMLAPVPNVIIFQFNPEKITHSWSQPEATVGDKQARTQNPLAVSGMPGESFSFTLVMDANDQIARGNPLAKATGIASRLAALEMLMYPADAFRGAGGGGGTSGGLTGSVSLSAAQGGGAAPTGVKRDVPRSEVPTVLFVWGPGRIVPVRVTRLSIDEQLYDTLLNPTHAEAQIELRVLTPEELAQVSGPLKDVARAAYTYSQVLRQGLAIANLANAVESAVGMFPL